MEAMAQAPASDAYLIYVHLDPPYVPVNILVLLDRYRWLVQPKVLTTNAFLSYSQARETDVPIRQ